MMKEAIMTIAPTFGARRMMKDYLEKFYLPISRELAREEKRNNSNGEPGLPAPSYTV